MSEDVSTEEKLVLSDTQKVALHTLEDNFRDTITKATEKLNSLSSSLSILQGSKDNSLENIDEQFDDFIKLVNRRRHLLKNQVLNQFNEKVEDLDDKLSSASFTMSCIEKLKDHTNLVFKDMGHDKVHTFDEHLKKITGELESFQSTLKEIDVECQLYQYEPHDVNEFENMKKMVRALGKVHASDITNLSVDPLSVLREENDVTIDLTVSGVNQEILNLILQNSDCLVKDKNDRAIDCDLIQDEDSARIVVRFDVSNLDIVDCCKFKVILCFGSLRWAECWCVAA